MVRVAAGLLGQTPCGSTSLPTFAANVPRVQSERRGQHIACAFDNNQASADGGLRDVSTSAVRPKKYSLGQSLIPSCPASGAVRRLTLQQEQALVIGV